MKKNTKYTIAATLIFGIGAGVGTWYAVDKSKKDAESKEKTESAIKHIQYENAQLRSLVLRFDKQTIHYADSAANYAKQNPQYDDMQSIYDISVEITENLSKNYQVLEKKFLKKISSMTKKFCYPDGGYNFTVNGEAVYHKPVIIEDYMQILEDNKTLIQNFAAIKKEYEQLKSLEQFMESFYQFVDWDMFLYVDTDKTTKSNNQKIPVQVIDDRDIYDFGDKGLENQSYRYVDAVHAFNNQDNVQQEMILDTLFNRYLLKLQEYNKQGMKLIDKNLFDKICKLSNIIKQHNKIESGKVSYEQALADVYKQLQVNNHNMQLLHEHIK